MRLIALILIAAGLLAQTPLPSPFIGGSSSGGGTPGGSNTQCQYNNSGAFGGITGCTTNGTAVTLVAPALGTPTALVLTSATGLPAASILPGTFGAGNYTVNGNLTVGITNLVVNTTALATAAAPTVTPVGATGTSHWLYKCQAYRYTGGMSYSAASSTTTITNGNATLDGTNKNNVACAAVTGADFIEIFRLYDAAMGTPATSGPIGSVSGSGGTLVDNGLPGPISLAFALSSVVPLGSTSVGLSVGDYINQADLGDVENQAWFGTARLGLPNPAYLRASSSKYVFSHSGPTDTLIDTVLIQTLSTTTTGNSAEVINFANGSTGSNTAYGAVALYAESGNVGATNSDAAGMEIFVGAHGSGNIPNGYGIVVDSPNIDAAGSFGDWYGTWVRDTDTSTFTGTAYAYYTDMSADPRRWAFYSAGTAANKLPSTTFGALVAYADSAQVYCSDCTVTTVAANVVSNATCAGSGGGAVATRIGSAWKCSYTP